MGALCGKQLTVEEKEARKKSKAIEKEQAKEEEQDFQVNKLLLLGAGESGKSTLFKQLLTIYGDGYPELVRVSYKNTVYQNTVNPMVILLNIYDEKREEFAHCVLEESNIPYKQMIQSVDTSLDIVFTKEMADAIQALWKDSAMQYLYEHRSKFQFPDSGSYFIEKCQDFVDPAYIPSQQDLLRVRVRTTGILENSFSIGKNKFRMFDVGGQRNERKKWIHCFENVTAVIFVAAISEYDQKLFEDETVNRCTEALNLFAEICNSKWFINTSMILFLNKKDLFLEKVQHVPISDYFPEYYGNPNDFEDGCNFFKEQFESRNEQSEKEVYTHVTCATDEGNIAHVFNTVKDIVIKQSLRAGGVF